MSPLEEYAMSTSDQLVHKWPHYFDIYHRHLAKFRDRAIVMVEFGVYHGGSMQMWQEYFGGRARVIGVDIDPRTAELRELGLDIRIGDQADRGFLQQLRAELGVIDVIVEDGGHRMEQQIATTEELFPTMAERGVMIVEDVHTSYWPEYGGGLHRPGSFIQWTKSRLDDLNYWHQREEAEPTVLERGNHDGPPRQAERYGTPSFPD